MANASKKGAGRRKRTGVSDLQLPLPLFEHGLQAAHQWPLVGDETKYTRGRRPAQEAWRDWPYIESNPPHAYSAMIFDIDDPDRWEKRGRRPHAELAGPQGLQADHLPRRLHARDTSR